MTKTLLGGLAGAAALTLGAALPASAQSLTVVLSYIPNVENFGALYAREKGYFKEAGLDVKLIPGGNGIDQVQMVSSGIAQLGMTAAESVVAAVDKGAPLKVIAGQFQTAPTAMTCRKDSGITSPKQVVGRKLGVKQAAQVFATAFLGKNGVNIADVKVTPIGNSDISNIIAGTVECMITTFAFNEPRLIEQAGVPVNVLPLGSFGMNSQSGSWIVRNDFLEKPENKKILAAYMKAEAKAWTEYFKDPAAAAKFIVDGKFNDGLNIDQQTFQAVQQANYMKSPLTAEKGILWVDPKTWEETTANALEAKTASKKIDPAAITTTEILEMAGVPKI
ncbi:ABC transporter substrate-binding protein [uncultured Alsobacter sp.]|uniref:ABC transporter substrate-binding protein n=1 Tax=uncultured Alsobacter sp. TaxID=1748258 RepID=UPI0025E8628F|nr:ABC transporter substrate-binding protein [uncultured Alsobacter sp.]